MIQDLCQTLQLEAKQDGIDRLVVRAIIEEQGKTLYLQRGLQADSKPGMFEFPGGRVDALESLEAALLREVAEETGLEVTDIIDCIGSCDYVGGQGEQVREFIFYLLTKPGMVKISKEHEAFAWFTLPETYDQPIIEHMKGITKIFWYLALFQSLVRDAEEEGIMHYAVSAAVSNGDRLLLLHNIEGTRSVYSFPQGSLQEGEQLFEGLMRIVFTATHLLVTDLVMHINNRDFVDAEGVKRRQFNFMVEVESLDPLTKIPHEAYLWATLLDLETLQLADSASDIAKAAMAIN